VYAAITVAFAQDTLSSPQWQWVSLIGVTRYPGNLVVAVEGCGVYYGTSTNVQFKAVMVPVRDDKSTMGAYGTTRLLPYTVQFTPTLAKSRDEPGVMALLAIDRR
jgi:hypothetical protein